MLEEENEDDEVDEGFDKTTSPTLRMRLEAVDDFGPEYDGKWLPTETLVEGRGKMCDLVLDPWCVDQREWNFT